MNKLMKPFKLITQSPLDFTRLSLESERLRLVSINESYAPVIFKEFNDDIIQYMLPKPADEIEETLNFIDQSMVGMREGWNLVLVITDRSNGDFLGCCGLHGEGRYRTPELGIWIKKSAHGNKYGLEAIQTLANWSFQNIDVDYLIYPVDRANIPSRKIAETLGGVVFREKQVKTDRGGYLDEVQYKILSRNFTPRLNTKWG